MSRFLFYLWKELKVELLITLLVIAFLSIFVPIFTYYHFASDLKSKEGIMNKNDTGVVLLDRSGQPFFTFYQAHTKTYVPLSDIPQYTKQAVISAEDKNFYTHPGFSIPGILRSVAIDVSKQEFVYGGSTITQQLVKNSLLYSNKSVSRKVQEIILANEIERRYSKNEILEMYLNSVYFGQ